MPKKSEEIQALQTLRENLNRIYEFLGCKSILKLPSIAESSSAEDAEAANLSQTFGQDSGEEAFSQELPELIYLTEIIYMINDIKNGVLEKGLGCRLIYTTESVELRRSWPPEFVPTNLDSLDPVSLDEYFVFFLPSDYISFAFQKVNKYNKGVVFAKDTISLDEVVKITAGNRDFVPLPNFETARLRRFGDIELRKGTLIGIILSKELLKGPKAQILQYEP